LCLLLVQDKANWSVLAHTIIYFWIPQKTENLVNWEFSASEQRLFAVVLLLLLLSSLSLLFKTCVVRGLQEGIKVD
jgi:hypothetical protein